MRVESKKFLKVNYASSWGVDPREGRKKRRIDGASEGETWGWPPGLDPKDL